MNRAFDVDLAKGRHPPDAPRANARHGATDRGHPPSPAKKENAPAASATGALWMSVHRKNLRLMPRAIRLQLPAAARRAIALGAAR